MSTSVYIAAIKPPDDTWRKHKAVWEACEIAGVEVPSETMDYFDDEEPDSVGVVVSLGSLGYPEGDCIREFRDENYSGVEIEVSELPADTKFIRVTWG